MISESETITIKNYFTSLGPPLFGLIFVAYGLWIGSIPFGAGFRRSEMGTIAKVSLTIFFVALGIGCVTISYLWLRRVLRFVATRIDLGKQIFVRWFNRSAYYDYDELLEVEFSDFAGGTAFWQFSERQMGLRFFDGQEAVVTIRKRFEKDLAELFHLKDVAIRRRGEAG